MLLVALDKLKDGIVLSEDVRDTNGRLLLTKGTAIEASHIRLLKFWGVHEVQVLDTAQADAPGKSDRDIDKLFRIESNAKIIFQNLDTDHPAIHSILNLAALLLKIANSATYGLASKVDTLSRAVAILGTREVGVLAMVIISLQFFRDIPKDIIDMTCFLRHSLACGLLSRILCAQAKMAHTERLFLSGLLHDIGRLVLYRYFHEQAKMLLNIAKSTGLSVLEIETECLGINHTQIASHLLKKWKFPTRWSIALFITTGPRKARSRQNQASYIWPTLPSTHWDWAIVPCSSFRISIQRGGINWELRL